MDENKKTILAFPRSGTKLLAGIFERRGYHNFGEFFNTFSHGINNANIPYASRMPVAQQHQVLKTRKTRGPNLDNYTQTLIIQHRYKKFLEYADITPSIITTSNSTFDFFPEAVSVLSDRQVLCLRRINRFDQLLSRCITMTYLNHDDETKSRPSKIDKTYFEFCFYTLARLEKMQDRCVKAGNGIYIDFDELVTGRADLGFNYQVTTYDQHRDLRILVLNLAETMKLYDSLVNSYNLDWNVV
jgi:hypothetical protein